MSDTPYFPAAILASAMVESSEEANMATISAPALAAISTSKAPVSTVFMSATIFTPGRDFFIRALHSSLALDEWCAGLNPISAACDCLFGYLNRSIEF